MTKNSDIINWESVFSYSKTFQENKPTKWAFIEEFFVRDFYEQLYETYPKKDDSKTIQGVELSGRKLATGGGTNWLYESAEDTNAYRKWWTNGLESYAPHEDYVEDPSFSESWNKLYRYLFSDELISNFQKFSGVPINKPKAFRFLLLTPGGYQLPHIHYAGPYILILMLYFSKNWKKGDPGGTYVTPEEDESKMIFEPYNLDNTGIVFHDGPHAGHGARYITKDVERRAIQIYLEK